MKRRTFCKTGTAALAVTATQGFSADCRPKLPGGRGVSLDEAKFARFRAAQRGPVLIPGDPGYDTARRVWNASIDRRPALIARCRDVDDVRRAVDFGRTRELLLAVKAGGHSSSGKSVCDDGLMIDLSLMRGVKVDAHARMVTVEGGALLGDMDRACMEHGLATTVGTVSHTGVGGLTLGGGMGHLGRKFGLSVDNLVGAELVTADGERLHANATENADLFWAIRGGGGNFGIVTSFEFRLHSQDSHLSACRLSFPWPVAGKVLNFLRDYGQQVPDEATLTPLLLKLPDGTPMLGIGVHFLGSVEDAERIVAPLRKIAAPVNDSSVHSVEYLSFQTQFDDQSRELIHGYLKSGFVSALTPEFIDAAMAAVADAHTPPLQPIMMPQVGGAIARVDPQATAFPHRNAAYAVLFDLRWTDAHRGDSIVRWAREAWQRMQPYMQGVYVNFTSAEDAQARLRETYGVNLPRLVEIKRKYDPCNLFRLNVNIDPGDVRATEKKTPA